MSGLALGMFSPIIGSSDSISELCRVWLEDLYAQRSGPDGLSEDQQFDGFDVSSARFPKKGKCRYRVHDMLRPFPAQYHGLYDLVHVRYLAQSLRNGQYTKAATNLMDLLSKPFNHYMSMSAKELPEPGGYIQWEEIDYADITVNPSAPIHEELMAIITGCFRACDISIRGSNDAQAALKAAGFECVSREERNSYWENGLTHEVRKWAWSNINRCTARALIWSGLARDKDSAAIINRDMLSQLDREYSGGAVPNFAHRIVLGRKSVCDV